MFKTSKVLTNPNIPDLTYTERSDEDFTRSMPDKIYDYLMVNNLAEDREPKPFVTEWIDIKRGITREDIYMDIYSGSDHFYFDDYYDLSIVLKGKDAHVVSLLSGLDKCRCGCTLKVHSSNLGYTTLHCMNPFCPQKLPYIMADIARVLGVTGIGSVVFEATIWFKFCDNIKRTGEPHVRLIDVINEEYLTQFSSVTGDKMLDIWNGIQEFSGPLSELINMASLPYIGDIAANTYTPEMMTCGNLTLQEFWDMIKGGRIKSTRNAFIMLLYLPDIAHLAKCSKVNMNSGKAKKVPIAITGGVKFIQADGTIMSFKNKNEYIYSINNALCENNLGDEFLFVLKKSVTQDCVALINDCSQFGIKNNQAIKMNIPIIKSNEVFNILTGGIL